MRHIRQNHVTRFPRLEGRRKRAESPFDGTSIWIAMHLAISCFYRIVKSTSSDNVIGPMDINTILIQFWLQYELMSSTEAAWIIFQYQGSTDGLPS